MLPEVEYNLSAAAHIGLEVQVFGDVINNIYIYIFFFSNNSEVD